MRKNAAPENWARRPKTAQATALRARLILGCAAGKTNTAVARVLRRGEVPVVLAPMAVGGAIGVWRALRVEMTGMPQLIAMLHSFVGLAAVLVGYNTWLLAENLAENVAATTTGPHDAVHLGDLPREVSDQHRDSLSR